jgi:hypothetical protein
MSSRIAMSVLLLDAATSAAAAQPFGCPACRATLPYGKCDKAAEMPPPGAIGLAGTVVAIKPIKCGTQIGVAVSRATRRLPPRIEIAVGSCLYWAGKIGDAIDAAVMAQPSRGGIYRAYGC